MDFSDSSVSVYTNPEDEDTEALLKKSMDITLMNVVLCSVRM